MPKLSIIISVYKVEPYIRECLDSLIGQTFTDIQIILIDNGSPDSCGMVCDEYAAKDQRITVVHKEHGSLPSARNMGLEIATGEWIAFADSDDWCEPDYYEKLFTALGDREADIFWSGGGYRDFGEKKKTIRTVSKDFYFTDKAEIEHMMAKTLQFGPPWDKIFRTEFIRKHHLAFDPSDLVNEDVWFNFVAHDLAERIGGCTYIGYHWRMVRTSVTQHYNPEKPAICRRLIEKCHRYMEERQLSSEIRRAIELRCISQLQASAQCAWFHRLNTKSLKETKKEIAETLQWPYYAEAICDKDNSGLSVKQIAFKYLLKYSCLLPVKLFYQLKRF